MTKRVSLVERVIQRIDDRIAGLQFAREQLLEQQAAPKTGAPGGKKRTAAAAQEG